MDGGAGSTPAADASSLAATASQFIDDMEEQQVVPDRRWAEAALPARLVLCAACCVLPVRRVCVLPEAPPPGPGGSRQHCLCGPQLWGVCCLPDCSLSVASLLRLPQEQLLLRSADLCLLAADLGGLLTQQAWSLKPRAWLHVCCLHMCTTGMQLL
jgi:hypothetical protein